LSKRSIAPLAACIALALPASASAHARTPTVALDYRLVVDRTSATLPGIGVAILDGDRDLRLDVSRGNVVVLGDLGEQMLRIGPGGAYANAASPTAAAERLVAPGRGWRHVGGSSFAWHDHRLAPPPYSATPGDAGRFSIPALVNGRRFAFRGTFVRSTRPAAWPWLAGCCVATLALVSLLWLRPRRRATLALVTGSAAVAAALTTLVTFNAADAPNGRVAWAQILLGCALAAVGAAGLLRLHGESRTVLAGVLGTAAAVSSIGSLGVYRHGVVVSLLSPGPARAVAAMAICAGLAAAATLFVRDGAAT
jgi:hypothetical protein